MFGLITPGICGFHVMELETAICAEAAVYQMTGLLLGLLSGTEQPKGFVH